VLRQINTRNPVTISSTSKLMWAHSFGRIARGLASSAIWTRLVFTIATIAAILVSIASAPGVIGALGAGLAVLMLAIAAIDGRRFVIPDGLNAAGLALAFVHAAVQAPDRAPDVMMGAVLVAALRGTALALLFLIIREGYARLRGRQGLGLGDVKLAAVAGAWLGWSMMPLAIELAAFAALVVYLFRELTSGRPISMTNRLPFGLFLAPAIWVCWVLEVALL
jgi:leader peptidase (prepilin peptidase)/N-methyltransferase